MQLSNISLPVQQTRTERGRGGGWWVKTEKETLLKVDGGDTLTKLFSFQAVGDSQTEDKAGVVSPSVHGCLNTVYALNRFYS